ncbi:MAG: hypothetical protein ACP5OA_06950 [Candidatus Woesearchaeota archaeon]
MLKKFLERFKKPPEKIEEEEILLSKIDKHMNFLLRDKMGYINKSINEKIIDIIHKKDEALLHLRELHKSKLMNTNIPEREINIMEGNRENYIRRISHLVTNIEVPKNYLDTYDYCVKFSQELEQLNKDIQKNIFVLQHFFANEVKDTNKSLHDLEEIIIDIRVLLERNGILYLKEIQKDIKSFTDNALKIRNFNDQINTEKIEISGHQDKLDKLNERVKTITGGTDYKALEGFRQEKGAAENEIKDILSELSGKFSVLDTALKKYYYMYPDKKIAKGYLDDLRNAILVDKDLMITAILSDIKNAIEHNELDLKDKKKEHCLEAITKLDGEYLKDIQSKILRLEDQKQRAQTKITHNSASLNLSEQQYWMNATEDKIKYHNTNIEKLQKNTNTINMENAQILSKIRQGLEKLMDKHVELRDDISEGIISGQDMVDDNTAKE